MAPQAAHYSPKVKLVTKTVPTLQEELKETEKHEKIIKASVDEDQVARELKYFTIVKPCKKNQNVRYIYIDASKYGLVYANITMFCVLHAYYIYAMSEVINLFIQNETLPLNTWFFGMYLLKYTFFFFLLF